MSLHEKTLRKRSRGFGKSASDASRSAVSKELIKIRSWEVTSRACSRRQILVQEHTVWLDIELILKHRNKLREILDLLICEWFAITVPDEADLNRLGGIARIESLELSTFGLVEPAVREMDLAVAHSCAVSDEEVVSETVVSDLLVLGADGFGGTCG